jgi:hypothetical protein
MQVRVNEACYPMKPVIQWGALACQWERMRVRLIDCS